MKRLHIHVSVKDLSESIRFYSGLFAAAPSVRKDDYAKWMVEDPRVNFAISTRGGDFGVDHLGIQAEDAEELAEIENRAAAAGLGGQPEPGADCCYAHSDKHWLEDPQGVVWEAFHTTGGIAVYGSGRAGKEETAGACCAPTAVPAVSAACAADSGCCR